MQLKPQKSLGRVLYLCDKFGVTSGYEPAFGKMVRRAGIPREKIILANVHKLIDKPLVKYRNEKTLRFNPDRKEQILSAFRIRVNAIKPTLIVCSDPVTLGIFTGWDQKVSTLDKCRGGVYDYMGIPVIITLPVTAIHRNIDERLVRDDEGEDVSYEPYRIPQGSWILARDWEKASRYFHGKQRRVPDFQYSICRTLADCFAAREWLLGCSLISVDIETACFPAQITCIGYTGIRPDGKVRSFVVPFFDEYSEDGCFWADENDHMVAYSVCRDINESNILKVLQNGNYDASYFIRDLLGLNNYLFDTMLMWYALYMELPKTLDFISSILLDSYQYWKDDIKGSEEKDEIQGNMEKYWRYNALDTHYTLFNCLYLLRLMNANPVMQSNYRDVFMRNASALQISMRGVKADFKRLGKHRDELKDQYETRLKRFRYLIADAEFNVNSPAQKTSLLYDVLGAKPRNARGRVLGRDAKESPSSGAIALKAVKSEHPVFKYVVSALESAMEPDKQMGNITGRKDEDGTVKGGIKFFTDRFRTCYGAAGTTSTRFNSKGSNFWDGCVPAGSEVLTPEGWVAIETFESGMQACVYDPAEEVFQFASCDLFIKSSPSELYVGKSNQLTVKITSHHRMLAKRAHESGYLERPAHQVAECTSRIPTGAVLGGDIEHPAPEIQAMLMADGSVENSGWRIELYKPRKIARFLTLCRQYGIRYTIRTPSREGGCRFGVAWKDQTKTLGPWILNLSSNSKLRLLNEMQYWDGTKRGKSFVFYTASQEQAKWVVTLASLCGKSATYHWSDSSQESYGFFEGKGGWKVNVKPRPYSQLEPKHWTRSIYEKPVYCLTTPTGYFLIRQAGSIHITGNTNAQNIRASMRDFLVADPGCILMDVDYSQSDDVFMGYESNDHHKIEVIESGVDGHAVHGELFFKMPYDEIVAGKKADDPLIIHPIFGIRQLAKRIVHGTNFQMAAVTLFMTMGRDAVVAAMQLMGYKDSQLWSQDQLVSGCQMLMNAYRRKYPRLTPKEYYKEIADLLKTKGTITNAFGIVRRFLGDPTDSGTQREATGFVGQSDTAGNMNRSMYEIDHGWMPTYFRDGENPDRHEEPRRMTLDSHGFRFLLQTHDSFTAQLNLDHPRFEEAANNLLHVMERPVIINGHVVRVKTEASFGFRWGKKMIEWNPQKDSLSSIVDQAMLLEAN